MSCATRVSVSANRPPHSHFCMHVRYTGEMRTSFRRAADMQIVPLRHERTKSQNHAKLYHFDCLNFHSYLSSLHAVHCHASSSGLHTAHRRQTPSSHSGHSRRRLKSSEKPSPQRAHTRWLSWRRRSRRSRRRRRRRRSSSATTAAGEDEEGSAVAAAGGASSPLPGGGGVSSVLERSNSTCLQREKH